jgi:hypothetical protein
MTYDAGSVAVYIIPDISKNFYITFSLHSYLVHPYPD